MVLQERDVPVAMRSVDAVANADYVDVFTVTVDGATGATPEQWARAGIDHAAGFAGQFVWRVLLQLRLASPASSQHIAGWTIAEHGDGWIRLEASSWCMTAHLVVRVDGDRVTVATFLRYDRAIAARIWPLASIGHRRAMPGLLRRAARVIGSVS